MSDTIIINKQTTVYAYMQIPIVLTLLLLVSSTIATRKNHMSGHEEVRRILSLTAGQGSVSLEPFINASKDLSELLSLVNGRGAALFDETTMKELEDSLEEGKSLDLRDYDIDGTGQLQNIFGQSLLSMGNAQADRKFMLSNINGAINSALGLWKKVAGIQTLKAVQLKAMMKLNIGNIEKSYKNVIEDFAKVHERISEPAKSFFAAAATLESIRKRIGEYREPSSDWMQDRVDHLYQTEMPICHPGKSLEGICVKGYKRRVVTKGIDWCENCIERNYAEMRKDFIIKKQGEIDHSKHACLDAVNKISPLATQGLGFDASSDRLVAQFNKNIGLWGDMLAQIQNMPETGDFRAAFDKLIDTTIPPMEELQKSAQGGSRRTKGVHSK